MRVKEAKKILPKSEYEAFESILLNQLSKIGSASLMKKATLSRRLRDKYRDLSRHQVAGAKTRRTNEVDTDLYDRKARIFQDLMNKIEEELAEKKLRTSGKAGVSSLSPAERRKARRQAKLKEDSIEDQRVMREARQRSR